MKVVMLQDWHGVEKSVERQIELLPKYAPNAKRTKILHEPITITHTPNVNGLLSGQYSLERFWEDLYLKNSWGPSDPYKKLYEFSCNNEYGLGPLDHHLWQRRNLAQEFKELVTKYLKKQEDSMILSGWFDRLKRQLSFGRELEFCKRVDYSKHEFETVVVITNPAHVTRCADYLANTQGYDVLVADVDPQLAEELSKEEDELQLRFAKEKKILEMPTPPLVPIVVKAFNELNFP